MLNISPEPPPYAQTPSSGRASKARQLLGFLSVPIPEVAFDLTGASFRWQVRAPALGLTSHSTYDLFDQRIWIALMLGYLRRITSHFPISDFSPRLFQHRVTQHLDQPLPPLLHLAFE